MSEVGSLSVGVNVDIQRTDGRIHSAVISAVNVKTKTVTVEWYERGESKGKEIDIKTIFSLNPSFAPKEMIHQTSVEAHGEQHKVIPQIVSNVNSAANQTLPNSRSTMQHKLPEPLAKVQQPTGTKSRVPTTSRVPVVDRQHVPTSQISFLEEDDRTETENDYTQVNDKRGQKANAASQSAAAAATAARKSNCVKEIEKIQKMREERRAAQKAIRDQPEYDPSNPNYDFLMMIKDYQDSIDIHCPSYSDPIEYHQICVCVRKRPLNKRELGRKEIDVITVPNKQTVIVHEPKLKVDLTKYLENQAFRFDYAFDDSVDNATVYRYTAKPLVDCIFDKGMATCFAYGQTGSGKTHTMGGEFSGKGQQNYSGGIYTMAASDVFNLLQTKYRHEDLIVQVSFFEIYGGKVFDLLNNKEKLRILEDHKSQVQIVGLKATNVSTVDDILQLLATGNANRTSGQTSANIHSSRSHAVFQLILKKRVSNKLWGKFSLIDLAGNERGADTSSSDRNTRMEGAEINKSLLALKECIRALGRKGAHRPFRASKLTQVLRDSFIGTKSRTCMISMISPGMLSCEHTLNTLRYADRVKELGPGNPNEDNSQQQYISGSGDYESEFVGQQRTPMGIINNQDQQTGAERKPLTDVAEAGYDDMYDEYDDNMEMENGGDEGDDLAMLRSANADFDEEMFKFQELVNKIEQLEDNVCEKHKNIAEKLPAQLRKHHALFKMTKQVDYSLDDYAMKLQELLDEQIKELVDLRDNVQVLRHELKREEEISNSILANRNCR